MAKKLLEKKKEREDKKMSNVITEMQIFGRLQSWLGLQRA